MLNRCGILKKMDLFHLLYSAKLQAHGGEQLFDKEKLETSACLEYVLASCYKSLMFLIHNRNSRKEFQHLSQRSLVHQEHLMKLLEHEEDSEHHIEIKREQYLFNLNIDQLSVVGVLNLAISMSEHTMDIYKYLSRTCPQYGSLLDRLVQDNTEEIEFLRNELEFHSPSRIPD